MKITKCKEHNGRFYFDKLKFTSKNSKMFEIEHSLLASLVAIFQYEWGSHIHFKSTEPIHKIPGQFVNKP